MKHILTLILLILGTSVEAETLTLASDQEVNVEEYGSDKAKHHILWLVSERGITAELQQTVLAISNKENLHILMPDWHDSYFLTPTRSSLEKIPAQDYLDLIRHYSSQYQKLFVVATSRAAGLALNAAHQLQSQKTNSIASIIFIAPYLQTQTPKIGENIEYQQIASKSNLPLYIFQPERSPRFVPLPKLVKTLEEGGSQVYTHVLKNITGGFHMRDKADLNEDDLKAIEELPKQFSNAISMLNATGSAPLKPVLNYETVKRTARINQLKKVQIEIPQLQLKDIQGSLHKLLEYRGKIVIVSFWASWCRPCIEEMPSLVALKEKHKDSIEILAVNVRENSDTIKQFTQSMNINFPLLQDHDSSITESWKVYVYPSNFVVDKTGKLRFAATGAMDWQDAKIESQLKSLF